jgi:hypothetical protein
VNGSPAYQGLVFICQALVFAGLAAWWLRGTRPGRDVCKAVVWLTQAPARRRAAQARDAWANWVTQYNYWAGVKRQHHPGTRQYEVAQDFLNALQQVQPRNPYPCPHTAFTCATPGCSNHPRSPR